MVSSACAEASVELLHVYIIEAHPKDEWAMDVTPGWTPSQPKVLQERLDLANQMASDLGVVERMVVDDITNPVDTAYESRPERLYVLEDGHIVWRSGLGPFQYDVEGLGDFLKAKKSSM